MILPHQFFKPSNVFREMGILLTLDEDTAISRHRLARRIGVGTTMAHHYVTRLIGDGLVAMTGRTRRAARYTLTPAGRQRLEQLASQYAREMARLYLIAKQECRKRLLRLYDRGMRRIVLFGAAETGELALSAAKETPVQILGLVDNDREKQRTRLGDWSVEAPERIEQWHPDAVVITASRYADDIYEQIRHVERQGIHVEKL
jgi:DNA-binding MarR family transcriptional regulator